jgi:hypothetical protein
VCFSSLPETRLLPAVLLSLGDLLQAQCIPEYASFIPISGIVGTSAGHPSSSKTWPRHHLHLALGWSQWGHAQTPRAPPSWSPKRKFAVLGPATLQAHGACWNAFSGSACSSQPLFTWARQCYGRHFSPGSVEGWTTLGLGPAASIGRSPTSNFVRFSLTPPAVSTLRNGAGTIPAVPTLQGRTIHRLVCCRLQQIGRGN